MCSFPKSVVFSAIAILLLIPASSFAQNVPTAMNYQGLLNDATGNPVPDATYSVVFTIYDAASGGNSKWSETRSVTTGDGLFSILLGTVNPIEDTVFNAPTRYFGIKVGTDPELSPRTMIVTVPYATRVSTVDGASGGSITNKVSIGPGHINSGANSFVAGIDNDVRGDAATVGGGRYNKARGEYSVVAGGLRNQAIGDYSFIGGGGGAVADSNVAGGLASTISGGRRNFAGIYCVVGGGARNAASGMTATVSGGWQDTASGEGATVGGGTDNISSNYYTTVSGGERNEASGSYTTIGGGFGNLASSTVATVSGGDQNTASGLAATVAGGLLNSATGDYSFAAGRRSKANHSGTFVWGDDTDSDFVSTGANQFLIRATGGVGIGINAPAARLHVKGPGWPRSFGYFDTEAAGQDAGLRFYEKGTAKSHVYHQAGANTLNLYGEGFSGISVTSTGDVGIGTSAPNYKLDVRGSIGNNATLYHSDLRWKTNIATLSNSLDQVQKLRGVYYDWNRKEYSEMNFPEGRQIGLIAQEVEEAIPEVVQTDADGYKSVDYGKLVALLIEANKEQQGQIDELRELVDRLTTEAQYFQVSKE